MFQGTQFRDQPEEPLRDFCAHPGSVDILRSVQCAKAISSLHGRGLSNHFSRVLAESLEM